MKNRDENERSKTKRMGCATPRGRKGTAQEVGIPGGLADDRRLHQADECEEGKDKAC